MLNEYELRVLGNLVIFMYQKIVSVEFFNLKTCVANTNNCCCNIGIGMWNSVLIANSTIYNEIFQLFIEIRPLHGLLCSLIALSNFLVYYCVYMSCLKQKEL